MLYPGVHNLALQPDSGRFAVLEPGSDEKERDPLRVTFVINFFDELGKKLQAR